MTAREWDQLIPYSFQGLLGWRVPWFMGNRWLTVGERESFIRSKVSFLCVLGLERESVLPVPHHQSDTCYLELRE